uniref:Ig-like domain-containing protein n=1 Tax=Callorhinchus milii TaxID=7868 RepID=A0A4W3HL96_CALMI
MSWKHCIQVLWFVLPLSLAERFTVSGPALPVPAIAGSDVVLDCKCSTDLPREGVEVRWFRTRYESPVYLYSEGRDHLGKQDEAYRHRTILFVEEFINGNVSLRLEDVRVSDNGEYTCLVSYARWHEEALIELKHSDGVRLLCVSSGWFPAPEVLWFDDQGNNLTILSHWTVREDSKGLFFVKSQIEIIHSTNKIRCLIHSSENEQEGKLQISVTGHPHRGSRTHTYTFWSPSDYLLLFIVSINFPLTYVHELPGMALLLLLCWAAPSSLITTKM